MTNCSKANGKTHLSVLSQLREERRKKSQHDTLRVAVQSRGGTRVILSTQLNAGM